MEETHNNKLFITALVSVVIIIFVLLIGALMVTQLNSKKGQNNTKADIQKENEMTNPLKDLDHGSLTLTTTPTAVVAGSTVSMMVVADSAGKMINGYDVVLKYDPTLLEFSSFKPLQQDFQVFQVDKTNTAKLTLTGTKRLNTNPIIFAQTQILEVSFKALKKGNASVSFDYAPLSRTDSNLVSSENKDVLGSTNGLELNIN
jgi:hypothetical protein